MVENPLMEMEDPLIEMEDPLMEMEDPLDLPGGQGSPGLQGPPWASEAYNCPNSSSNTGYLCFGEYF